jgi:hypothetical protein
MPFANERIERKVRILEQIDAEHVAKLDPTFTNHLASAIQSSSQDDRQQALDKAIEAYESALDGVLYGI